MLSIDFHLHFLRFVCSLFCKHKCAHVYQRCIRYINDANQWLLIHISASNFETIAMHSRFAAFNKCFSINSALSLSHFRISRNESRPWCVHKDTELEMTSRCRFTVSHFKAKLWQSQTDDALKKNRASSELIESKRG